MSEEANFVVPCFEESRAGIAKESREKRRIDLVTAAVLTNRGKNERKNISMWRETFVVEDEHGRILLLEIGGPFNPAHP